MGQTEKIQDSFAVAAQASARYGTRGVPGDWYVDPTDPDAAVRHEARALEDAATAFLAAHEALTGSEEQAGSDVAGGGLTGRLEAPRALTAMPRKNNPPTPERLSAPPARREQAIWIGLPGIGQGYGDEGDLGWQADALCAQTDPEAFFPEKGGSTRDAKKVCDACTVRSECLEYALSNDERFGIWGGMSERERRRLRKRVI